MVDQAKQVKENGGRLPVRAQHACCIHTMHCYLQTQHTCIHTHTQLHIHSHCLLIRFFSKNIGSASRRGECISLIPTKGSTTGSKLPKRTMARFVLACALIHHLFTYSRILTHTYVVHVQKTRSSKQQECERYYKCASLLAFTQLGQDNKEVALDQ